jgi:hypothetical protein
VIQGQSCLFLHTSGVCASSLNCSVPVNMETTLCWTVQLAVVPDIAFIFASSEPAFCCRIALMAKDSMWVWKRDKGKSGNQGRLHLTQRQAMPSTSETLPKSDLLIPSIGGQHLIYFPAMPPTSGNKPGNGPLISQKITGNFLVHFLLRLLAPFSCSKARPAMPTTSGFVPGNDPLKSLT